MKIITLTESQLQYIVLASLNKGNDIKSGKASKEYIDKIHKGVTSTYMKAFGSDISILELPENN